MPKRRTPAASPKKPIWFTAMLLVYTPPGGRSRWFVTCLDGVGGGFGIEEIALAVRDCPDEHAHTFAEVVKELAVAVARVGELAEPGGSWSQSAVMRLLKPDGKERCCAVTLVDMPGGWFVSRVDVEVREQPRFGVLRADVGHWHTPAPPEGPFSFPEAMNRAYVLIEDTSPLPACACLAGVELDSVPA